MSSPTELEELRAAVATTARRLASAELAEAFGHVSARWADGMVISSVRPLVGHRREDTVVVDAAGHAIAGPADELPLETPMHLAVYRERADVGAICRGHPRAAVAWGTAGGDLPLVHGLGALAGPHVGVYPDIALVTDTAAGNGVAAALGDDAAILLRGNGAVAVGTGLDEAATRLWFVEERARLALVSATPADDDAWRRRMEHSPAELRRAIAWFVAAHPEPETA